MQTDTSEMGNKVFKVCWKLGISGLTLTLSFAECGLSIVGYEEFLWAFRWCLMTWGTRPHYKAYFTINDITANYG